MVDYSPYQMRPNESFVDYIARLSNSRQSGILGTGGLMDVVAPQAAETSQPLGEVVQNCPEGYVWNGTACVKAAEVSTEELPQVSKAESLQASIDRMTGRAPSPSAVLPSGIGLLGDVITSFADPSAVKSSFIKAGYTPEDAEWFSKNPEAAAQAHASGYASELPTQPYKYEERGDTTSMFDVASSVVGSIFGLDSTPTPPAMPTPLTKSGMLQAYPLPLVDSGLRFGGMLAEQRSKELTDPTAYVQNLLMEEFMKPIEPVQATQPSTTSSDSGVSNLRSYDASSLTKDDRTGSASLDTLLGISGF